MYLPLFPLSMFLLPGGITRLRIFEQKYVLMIKNIDKTDGFVICKSQPIAERESNWGSWMELIDFYPGDDGFLLVDVRCKHLVELSSVVEQPGQVSMANVNILDHWADDEISASIDNDFLLEHSVTNAKGMLAGNLSIMAPMVESLESICRKKADLYGGYYNYFDAKPSWVCARWLELLPLNQATKDYFSKQNTFIDAMEFLMTLLTEKAVAKFN